MKWEEPFDGGNSIQGYMLEKKEMKRNKWYHVTNELIKTLEYKVTVVFVKH